MGELDKKIFCVLKDPVAMIEQRDGGEKTEDNTFFFNLRFASNGSRELIQSDLSFALAEFIMNMAEEKSGFARMPDAPTYSYCMNDSEGFMNSFFLIWYVTRWLRTNDEQLQLFSEFLEVTVVGWATTNKLKCEVLKDREGAYWMKFIITIPVELLNPKHTEHEN